MLRSSSVRTLASESGEVKPAADEDPKKALIAAALARAKQQKAALAQTSAEAPGADRSATSDAGREKVKLEGSDATS